MIVPNSYSCLVVISFAYDLIMCLKMNKCVACFVLLLEVPDDWDQVKTSDVRKMSPTHSLLTTSNMIIGSLSKTVSSVTKAMGLCVFCIT